MKNCDHLRDLFEGYALGVLDAEERTVIEAHLATGCADCAKSVGEARWLVSQLAYMAADSMPSEMLKGRLMRKIRAEARDPQSAGRFKTSVPFWMWAGVAALFLVTLYLGWDAHRLQEQIRAANDQTAAQIQERTKSEERLAATEAQLANARKENAILTDPASARITLAAQNFSGPQLEVYWHAQYGMVLTGQRVPVPPGNRVLQLWLIPKAPGGKPIPSLTLRPDADGKFVLLVSHPPEVAAGTKALAITEEPLGGSSQPTAAPRWVGRVG